MPSQLPQQGSRTEQTALPFADAAGQARGRARLASASMLSSGQIQCEPISLDDAYSCVEQPGREWLPCAGMFLGVPDEEAACAVPELSLSDCHLHQMVIFC